MKQKEAFEILKLGNNVYLTGSAGSGKTFLLNKYINFLKSKNVEVGITASTGIAATHMNGMTIHSWSGIGIKDNLTEKDLKSLMEKSYLKKRFEKTKVLIIDEVSMLHPHQLDLVDMVLKVAKQSLQPFGGVQVVLCGDFFQLPPVSKNNEPHFINKSEIWDNMNLKVCYLNEQFRQKDNELSKILNDIRENNTGEHTLVPLRKRYKGSISGSIKPTKLYTHNIDVDRINFEELNKLEGEVRKYEMEFSGNSKLAENLKNSCLAPETLYLKKDAIVMFVKNNFDEGYVNGTLGKVIDFNNNNPIIKTLDGKEIMVDAESWRIEESGKTKAEIYQVPLRLAWAITIHKSQGMTLDAAEIDLSKSFVYGMGYVALSRLRTMEGLRLMGLNKNALLANADALELDKKLLNESSKNVEDLNTIDLNEKEKQQKEFLSSVVSEKEEEKESTYEKTRSLVTEKLSISEIATRREMKESTIFGHLEKLNASMVDLDLDYLISDFPKERFLKIKNAFSKTEDRKLSPVREILGEDFSYEELRLVRLFLD